MSQSMVKEGNYYMKEVMQGIYKMAKIAQKNLSILDISKPLSSKQSKARILTSYKVNYNS